MNKHLEAAVKRWESLNKKQSFLIAPISEIDAIIIHELIQSLGKLKDEKAKDLKIIIENWKYLKDDNISDLLLQFNIDNVKQSDTKDIEEEIKKRKFIKFEDQIIEIYLIKTIGTEEEYNYVDKTMKYKIVINKDLEEKYQLTNGYFFFKSKQLRDDRLKEFKNKLKDFIEIIGEQE